MPDAVAEEDVMACAERVRDAYSALAALKA
jgi:hypothetical protein